MYEGSLFSASSPTFVISGLFDDSHSDRCEVISHCSLICISLMANDIEHLFMCHSYILFDKMFMSLVHFSIDLFFTFEF